MKIRLLYFLVGIFFVQLSPVKLYGQQTKLDSLLSSVPSEKNEDYIDHIIKLARLNPYALDTTLALAKAALPIAKKLKYPKGSIDLHRAIAIKLYVAYENEDANSHLDKSLNLLKKVNVPESHSKTLRLKAKILNRSGDYRGALPILLEALDIAKANELKTEEANVNSDIGNIYRLLYDPKRAIPYFNRAEEIFLELGMQRQACLIIIDKANTWKTSFDTLDKKKALSIYLNFVDTECFGLNGERSKAITATSLGSSLYEQGRYEESEKYLLMGYELKKKNKLESSLLYSYSTLTSLYAATGRAKEAIKFGELAKKGLEKFPNPSLEFDLLRNLSQAYFVSGNSNKAYSTLKKCLSLFGDIKGEEEKTALLELETKYNVTQKEKEIANRDLEIARQENRYTRLALFAFLALGAIGGFYFWYRWKTKKQVLEAEQIKEMDRLRSTFFTNVSHEFRTPLSLILAPIQKWEKQLTTGSQNIKVEISQSVVAQMGRSTRRLKKLTDQLLDLAKMDAGKMALNTSEADVAKFSENILSSFSQMAERQGVQLQFANFKEPFEIYFDHDVLEKILSNLLFNALKFTPENGRVKLMLNEKNGMAEFSIYDSGPGISPNELPHIFDRFYQAESNHKDQGSGVGLAFVKELVELHKGKIKVESEEGKGTTFSISLPMGKAHLKPSEIAKVSSEFIPSVLPTMNDVAKTENGIAKSVLVDRPTILIVEDNDDLRNYLSKSLNSDFEVLAAADGKLGWELATQEIPDLVISDIMMPNMNGNELCEKLKANEPTGHIPVILLTAKATRQDELAGLETGADEYIVKPFDEEILIRKTKNLIEQRNKLKLLFAEKVELRPHELKVESHEEGFLKNLLEVVEANLADADFNVEKLSQEVGMSRSQLFRKLKALTGETPTLFIRNIRLRRGRQLLEQKFGTVKEIAFAVGFSNPNYFVKCFKQEFGLTPGEAMNSQQKTS